MDTNLAATPRTTSNGKSDARKVRKAGQLPAVVYGPGAENENISVDPHALDEIFRKSQNANTIVNLQIGKKTVPALVRDVQRHPLTRKYIHVDFYRVSDDRDVVVPVPVTTTGKSAALAVGGRVQVVRRDLNVRCKPSKIPTIIEIDVTALNVGDGVRVSAVTAPAGCEIVYEQDFPVVAVAGKQREEVVVAATPVEGAAPAEGAAAAAPAAAGKGDAKKPADKK